ncbi:MAG: class I SAM-dependent methyltransferase [Acidobacteriota bacterium]
MDFSKFDTRNYPTMTVTEGYNEWASTYEQTVLDEMDLRLLSRSQLIAWDKLERTIDLACGTGRIGVWLKQQGVKNIDGIDISSEMLALAKNKGVYNQLNIANFLSTGIVAVYDLAIEVLADEHIQDLQPLYREVAKIIKPNGYFVIVGYHPYFLMKGIPTHFNRSNGEPAAIESYIHLTSDHIKAAHKSNLILLDMDEGIIDDEWIAKKPKWEKYRCHPVSFLMIWQKRV